MTQPVLELTSTQIGAIAENIVANALMKESGGRLSPFSPVADDDGIDLLIYDKITGKAVPVQIKSRTKALKKRGTEDRGNVVHFEVRATTIKNDDFAYLVAVLLSENLSSIDCAWFIPMKTVVSEARRGKDKFIIRPSRSNTSQDRFTTYRCSSALMLAQHVIALLDSVVPHRALTLRSSGTAQKRAAP